MVKDAAQPAPASHLHEHLSQAEPAAAEICAKGRVAPRGFNNGLSKALGVFLAARKIQEGVREKKWTAKPGFERKV